MIVKKIKLLKFPPKRIERIKFELKNKKQRKKI